MMVDPLDLDDAVAHVGGVAVATPLEPSRALTSRLGVPVRLKLENLQRTGSYKVRGGYTLLRRLSRERADAGVVAASAGNHAQGVALAASSLGTEATIFMSRRASLPKVEATRALGAEIRLVPGGLPEAMAAAEQAAASTGAVLVPPYDHHDVIAGQATVAAEILAERPETTTIVVPVGGGGLLAGTALAADRHRRRTGHRVRVVGVQAEAAPAFSRSVARGRSVGASTTGGIADGIAVGVPGTLPLEYALSLRTPVITVPEEDIARAILHLLERSKHVVEGAGAVAVAALLSGRVDVDGPTTAVVSGGNIDPLLLSRVIAFGMRSADRYLDLELVVPDSPGALSEAAAVLGSVGANVVDVTQGRSSATRMNAVGLRFTVEVRDSRHRSEVVASLDAAGLNAV